MAFIRDIAVCPAPYAISQEGFAKDIAKLAALDEKESFWLEKLYKASAIKTRYSVLEDFANHPFWQNGSPTTYARNELYKQHAKELSYKAASQSLSTHDKETITHIIFVTCTGILAPGIQTYLQKALNLPATACQFAVTMMGCFGGFKALQMADAFCSQQKDAKVLIVCTELCSLHFQQRGSAECQIGSALFADASAACIVSNDRGDFCMHRHRSEIIPDTAEKMTWEVADSGLIFGLKKEIPELIRLSVATFAKKLLPDAALPTDCAWPIHPGGKGILEAVEDALQLPRRLTDHSWRVLEKYGNVSSASFLFVLHEMLQERHNKWAIGLGFGPGLSFEGMLLEVL